MNFLKKNPVSDYVLGHYAVIFIFLLCFLVSFWPLFSASYLVNYDDNVFFLRNPLIVGRHFKNIFQIFFEPNNSAAVYVPLTMLSFFWENFIAGQQPFISHAINVVLHLSVCGLAFMLARELKLNFFAAATATFLFALHPLHVEPVAWITSRKDLIYSFFYLASLFAYARFVDKGKSKDYVFALVAAGLSVLAKPMALSLPLVLFLVDLIKARRWGWGLIIEKIPFFLVVEPVAGITFLMNSRSGVDPGTFSPLFWIWSASFYLQKFFLPVRLALFYPPPLPASLLHPTYMGALATFFVTGLSLWFFRSNRMLLFAVGWYVLSTFFLWRFDTYDPQMVADRFMYLPSLGLCFAIGAAFDYCRTRVAGQWALLGIGLIVLSFMVLTHIRSKVWDNPYRLWTSVIQRADHDKEADKFLSFALERRAETVLYDEFFPSSRKDVIGVMNGVMPGIKSLKMSADQSILEDKLKAFRYILAIRDLKRAEALDPSRAQIYFMKGMAYFSVKNYQKTEASFKKFLSLRPLDSVVAQVVGNIYEKMGQEDKALYFYSQATILGDVIPLLYKSRALLLYKHGAPREALADAVKWLSFKPDDEEMNAFALARALEVGNVQLAHAVSLNYVTLFPKNAAAHAGLAEILFKTGNCDQARSEMDQARKLGHLFPEALKLSFKAHCP